MRGALAILNQTSGKCKEVFVQLCYDGNAGEEVPEIPLRRLLIGLAENMRGFPCNTKQKEASACA